MQVNVLLQVSDTITTCNFFQRVIKLEKYM